MGYEGSLHLVNVKVKAESVPLASRALSKPTGRGMARLRSCLGRAVIDSEDAAATDARKRARLSAMLGYLNREGSSESVRDQYRFEPFNRTAILAEARKLARKFTEEDLEPKRERK